MPNMIAPWICARTVSGLMTVPQSTAQTTRRTRTAAVPRHFDFSNLRHIVPERELDRDATADPFRQRLSPAGFFGGKIEDRLGSGRLVEERPPIGDRILLRRRRQFVDEALGHEDIVRGSDAAPERRRNAWRFHPQILDVHVRQGIDQIDRALGRVGVETILEQWWAPTLR